MDPVCGTEYERGTRHLLRRAPAADVRVVECGSGPSLALETFQRLSISGKLFGQEFQSDVAAQVHILGLVNDPHAAATELLQDAIVRHGLADHEEDLPLGVILGLA